jgi:hypothetical protein
LKKNLNDRFNKIDKDVGVAKKMVAGYDKKQKNANQPTFQKGLGYFDRLISFDPIKVQQELDEEIAAV